MALLTEEIRIKDARMKRIASQRRPHYVPTERMSILELRAARAWSTQQTADAFLVTPATIAYRNVESGHGSAERWKITSSISPGRPEASGFPILRAIPPSAAF